MKKGLVLALALLTVFAFVGCDSDTKEEKKPYEPPADWKGLNEVTWEAKEWHDSGIADMVYTAAGTGAYNVTIKTRAGYSAVWFNYQAITFRQNWYISLTLPDSPKPSNVYALSMTAYNGNGTADLAWGASAQADSTGFTDIPGMDADGNVLSDLKFILERDDAGVDYYGIALQFYWPDTVAAGQDYTFKINMIKVNKFGDYVPPEPPLPPPPAGWDYGTKEVVLGEMDWVNNDNQMGWRSNGTDTTVTDLDIADLVAAKYLVLELDKAPAGGFQVVWQGNGTPGWAWNQADVLAGDGSPIDDMGAFVAQDGDKFILAVELSKAFAEKDYEGFLKSSQAKILVAYYNGGVAGLGIQKAYLAVDWFPAENSVDLGLEFTATNNATQQGWGTNGTDNKETDLDIADLKAAKYLVLKLGKKPIGGMQMIWQGNGNAWDWAQQNGILSNDGVPNAEMGTILEEIGPKLFILKIELSKAFLNYNLLLGDNSTQAKFYVAYYSSNVADLGIAGAYLEK